MASRSEITRFLVRFGLFYGLLIIPWPGWNEAYSAWLRSLGRVAAAPWSARWIVRFEPAVRTPARPLDTRIILADRKKTGEDGQIRGIVMEVDARGIGWVPTALLAALVVATPLPWRRRAAALASGAAGMQVFALVSLGAEIVANAGISRPGFWKSVIDGVAYTLVDQIGAGFTVAVLLWLIVISAWREPAPARPSSS